MMQLMELFSLLLIHFLRDRYAIREMDGRGEGVIRPSIRLFQVDRLYSYSFTDERLRIANSFAQTVFNRVDIPFHVEEASWSLIFQFFPVMLLWVRLCIIIFRRWLKWDYKRREILKISGSEGEIDGRIIGKWEISYTNVMGCFYLDIPVYPLPLLPRLNSFIHISIQANMRSPLFIALICVRESQWGRGIGRTLLSAA